MLYGGEKYNIWIFKGYDFFLIFSLTSIFFFIIHVIIKRINSKETIKDKLNYIFLLTVLLVLILPISKINSDKISTIENRNLNQVLTIIKNSHFNYNYGIEFEKWLNDHYRGREKVLKISLKFNNLFLDKVENDKAIEGIENWLFYKGDNSVLNYQNRNPLTK